MIPLVNEWFIDLSKEKQTPVEAPSYVCLKNIVPARSNTLRYPPDGFVRRRQFYEMK